MRWSVVIPYYNEKPGMAATLDSLGQQTRRDFRLILVDNGSTDGSEAFARQVMARYPDIAVTWLSERTPGQVHALKAGVAAAAGELIAICDADTFYPPHYLEAATRLYDAGGPGLVSVNAVLMPEGHWGWRARLTRWHWLGAAWLWPGQNHTSGAGQTFRLATLRAAGGYDPAIWPYCLKDHELMARVLKLGRQAYHRDVWCISSARRTSRATVRWTLLERLAYHFAPGRDRTGFFHNWLRPRFEARGLRDTRLRERTWERAPAAA
jgi:glycosyltransferase involved in cell wall biosynthesis